MMRERLCWLLGHVWWPVFFADRDGIHTDKPLTNNGYHIYRCMYCGKEKLS